MSNRPVKIFSITRCDRKQFEESSFLGQTLDLNEKTSQLDLTVVFNNDGPDAIGLSQFFNSSLDSCSDDDIALLVHDDVFIHEERLAEALNMAVSEFNVVGVCGNRNPDFSQPSWALRFNRDLAIEGWQSAANLSGSVGHFSIANPRVDRFGESPAECRLLDGLFLAVDVGVARRRGVRFDTRFKFHFYDLDFCRTATSSGMRLGTWPILVTHESDGSFNSNVWREAANTYLEKWKAHGKGTPVRSPSVQVRNIKSDAPIQVKKLK